VGVHIRWGGGEEERGRGSESKRGLGGGQGNDGCPLFLQTFLPMSSKLTMPGQQTPNIGSSAGSAKQHVRGGVGGVGGGGWGGGWGGGNSHLVCVRGQV
jgi:hypothetical protein